MVPVAVGDFHWSTKRAIRQIRNRGERQTERREREGGGGFSLQTNTSIIIPRGYNEKAALGCPLGEENIDD